MTERKVRVIKSPRLAAIGVAMLSGLILRGLEAITIMIMIPPSRTLAKHAADMLAPPTSSKPSVLGCSLLTNPKRREMRVARPATTRA